MEYLFYEEQIHIVRSSGQGRPREKLAFEQKPGDEGVGHMDIQGKANLLKLEHSCSVSETAQGREDWNKKEGVITLNCDVLWAKEMKLFCTEALSRLGYSQYVSQRCSQEYIWGRSRSG